ncbi:anti-sigma F factor [Gehongia tenuis]|uniref:Anti-sigma F factor n=1 Tax=Gehongia tenuis TaxID=2763655 RepID=A0A926D676_9FIRM|nr:anti-sigma F factor [Gehongia tenuis]
MKNEMRLEILSISENEAFARAVAGAFAAQLNPTLEELADIKMAVSEAVTNAIIHGYECDGKRMVEIHGVIRGSVVAFEVIDQGCGIDDVDQAREPFYTSKPDLERSGMGFTVMETFMDKVEVTSGKDKGTKVFMLKAIKAAKERETSDHE